MTPIPQIETNRLRPRALPTPVSYVSSHNARSIRLAKRLGGILEAQAQNDTTYLHVYRYQSTRLNNLEGNHV